MVIGGQPQLDADPFGRVEPAQRGEPPVGPACPQLEFPQRELEQDGRDDGHEAERLRGGRALGGVREVEARGGGDQAPYGQAGRQAGFGSRGPAGQQHRAHPGRPVQGQEQQVRPRAAQAHVVTGEPGQSLSADPGRHAREPAEQHVLGGRRSRLSRTRAAGHRLPACLRRTVIVYFPAKSGNLDHQSESILNKKS